MIDWSYSHWDEIFGVNATMIYSTKDVKQLEEQAADKIAELEKIDPVKAEEEKERIWRAIQEISRGNG